MSGSALSSVSPWTTEQQHATHGGKARGSRGSHRRPSGGPAHGKQAQMHDSTNATLRPESMPLPSGASNQEVGSATPEWVSSVPVPPDIWKKHTSLRFQRYLKGKPPAGSSARGSLTDRPGTSGTLPPGVEIAFSNSFDFALSNLRPPRTAGADGGERNRMAGPFSSSEPNLQSMLDVKHHPEGDFPTYDKAVMEPNIPQMLKMEARAPPPADQTEPVSPNPFQPCKKEVRNPRETLELLFAAGNVHTPRPPTSRTDDGPRRASLPKMWVWEVNAARKSRPSTSDEAGLELNLVHRKSEQNTGVPSGRTSLNLENHPISRKDSLLCKEAFSLDFAKLDRQHSASMSSNAKELYQMFVRGKRSPRSPRDKTRKQFAIRGRDRENYDYGEIDIFRNGSSGSYTARENYQNLYRRGPSANKTFIRAASLRTADNQIPPIGFQDRGHKSSLAEGENLYQDTSTSAFKSVVPKEQFITDEEAMTDEKTGTGRTTNSTNAATDAAAVHSNSHSVSSGGEKGISGRPRSQNGSDQALSKSTATKGGPNTALDSRSPTPKSTTSETSSRKRSPGSNKILGQENEIAGRVETARGQTSKSPAGWEADGTSASNMRNGRLSISVSEGEQHLYSQSQDSLPFSDGGGFSESMWEGDYNDVLNQASVGRRNSLPRVSGKSPRSRSPNYSSYLPIRDLKDLHEKCVRVVHNPWDEPQINLWRNKSHTAFLDDGNQYYDQPDEFVEIRYVPGRGTMWVATRKGHISRVLSAYSDSPEQAPDLYQNQDRAASPGTVSSWGLVRGVSGATSLARGVSRSTEASQSPSPVDVELRTKADGSTLIQRYDKIVQQRNSASDEPELSSEAAPAEDFQGIAEGQDDHAEETPPIP